MNTQNTIKPSPQQRLQGGLLIRFNYSKIEYKHLNINESIVMYEYEEIKVSVLCSKKDMIVAIIRCKYDVDDEISLLQKDKEDVEYIEHQERKELAKIVAKAVIDGVESLDWNELQQYASSLAIDASTKAEILEEIEVLNA